MSRNLLTTNCEACCHSVQVEEAPRLATKADVGRYENQYAGKLWCAHAHCPMCGAKYLAWFNYPGCGDDRQHPSEEHIDLSYRESFNDEPAQADLPTKAVTYWLVKRWLGAEGNVLEEEIVETYHSMDVI